jgi:hypothetical protein
MSSTLFQLKDHMLRLNAPRLKKSHLERSIVQTNIGMCESAQRLSHIPDIIFFQCTNTFSKALNLHVPMLFYIEF